MYWHALTCDCSSPQHEISVAADEGLRQHKEHVEGDVTDASKAAAMRAAVEEKIQKLRLKLAKLVAVANPDLTDGWLEEVLGIFVPCFLSINRQCYPCYLDFDIRFFPW